MTIDKKLSKILRKFFNELMDFSSHEVTIEPSERRAITAIKEIISKERDKWYNAGWDDAMGAYNNMKKKKEIR